MKRFNKRRLCSLFIGFLAVIILAGVPLNVSAASENGQLTENLTARTNGLTGTWSASNSVLASNVNNSKATADGNQITITATAGKGGLSGKAYSTTVTVTLTNKNADGKNMTLEFQSSGTTVSADSGVTVVSGSSPYVYILPVNKSVKISYANSTFTPTSRYITDINFYSDEDTMITFKPAPVNPDGSTVCSYSLLLADGTTQAITADSEIGFKQVSKVVPKSTDANYEFVGWRTSAGVFMEYTSSTTYLFAKPNDPVTVEPVFAPKTSGVYQVNGNSYFYWEDAMTVAKAAADSSNPVTVKLIKNATILNTAQYNKLGTYVTKDATTGKITYTVPQYVNFLVPFADTDAGQFNGSAEPAINLAKERPKGAFRVLTVSDNVTVVCQGNMNVNAQIIAGSPGASTGMTSGYYGQIKLGTGSELVINSGSSLTCYGYITGKGQVTAKKGAAVYEFLEIADWRGGSAASIWKDLGKNVFIISQFYIQNIETDYVIESGAISKLWTGLSASTQNYCASVNYYGSSGALFNLTSGTLKRTYNTSTYEVDYYLNGTATIEGISMKLYGITMNSAQFIMAFHSQMGMTVESGSFTINSDFKLLPGATVTVKEGATAEIAPGSKLYLYDYTDWTKIGFTYDNVPVNTACWSASANNGNGQYVRSQAASVLGEKSAQLIVDGELKIHGNLFVTTGAAGTTHATIAAPTNDPSAGDDGKTVYGETISQNWTSSSTDKIITGKGKITNTNNTKWPASNPTVHELDQYVYYKVEFSITAFEYLWAGKQELDVLNVSTVPAVGHMAGYTGVVNQNTYDTQYPAR